MTGTPPDSSRPAVWAPVAETVELVLEEGATSMSAREGGWWEATAQLPAGTR